jgi:hypothetical protein
LFFTKYCRQRGNNESTNGAHGHRNNYWHARLQKNFYSGLKNWCLNTAKLSFQEIRIITLFLQKGIAQWSIYAIVNLILSNIEAVTSSEFSALDMTFTFLTNIRWTGLTYYIMIYKSHWFDYYKERETNKPSP